MNLTALLSHPDELPEDWSRECKKAIPVSQLWDYVVPRKPFGDDLIRAEFRVRLCVHQFFRVLGA